MPFLHQLNLSPTQGKENAKIPTTIHGWGDSANLDAFARLRMSQPQTLFDSKQIFDNQPLFWDDQETSGGGTSSTHSVATARSRLAVSATTAGKRVRQTFQRFNYQPGKSQLVLMTAVLSSSGEAGIKASVGMFDDNNGLFFTSDNGTIKVVRRTKTSGTVVDNEVSQTDFNLDTMDGNGPSGVTIDPTKTQILLIDFEWLGVGRVRMGFVVGGTVIYCHQFLNANNLNVVYMSTPNLPLRYELENEGSGGAVTMDAICSTVISEGGSQDLGVLRYKSTAGTHLDAAAENTIYALLGIRLKSAYIGATVKLINTALQIHTASEKVEWLLIFNPTVANTFTYTGETNSAVETAVGGATNTVTNGTIVTGGYIESGGVASGGAGSGGQGIENALLLGSAIDGTVDEIVLCVRPLAGSADVDIEGALTWRELT